MLTGPELEALEKCGILQIKPDSLQELTEMVTDSNESIGKRAQDFFSYIENPYYFKIYGMPVQITFANPKRTIQDALYKYLSKTKETENLFL